MPGILPPPAECAGCLSCTFRSEDVAQREGGWSDAVTGHPTNSWREARGTPLHLVGQLQVQHQPRGSPEWLPPPISSRHPRAASGPLPFGQAGRQVGEGWAQASLSPSRPEGHLPPLSDAARLCPWLELERPGHPPRAKANALASGTLQRKACLWFCQGRHVLRFAQTFTSHKFCHKLA